MSQETTVIIPIGLPSYDRITSCEDAAGNRTTYYWDKRYTAPVHVEYEPAKPKLISTGQPPILPPVAAPAHRRVVCAAIKMIDGHIVVGIRHYSPDMRATMRRLYGESYHLKEDEQGFVNTHGEFLTREQAWIAAEANGQILYQVSVPGTLYSENVY